MRTFAIRTVKPALLVIAFVVFMVDGQVLENYAAAQTEGQRTFDTPAEGVKL